MNKALLVSKNLRPFRWGGNVYILYFFLCVSVLLVYPKVLAVWEQCKELTTTFELMLERADFL